MDPNQFNIVHKEVNSQSRTIKEAMFICIQDPTLTETCASINYCTYGTNYYRHHQHSSTSQHNSQKLHNPPTGTPSHFPLLSHYPFRQGEQHFFLILFPMVSTCVHTNTPLSLSTIRPTAAPSW